METTHFTSKQISLEKLMLHTSQCSALLTYLSKLLIQLLTQLWKTSNSQTDWFKNNAQYTLIMNKYKRIFSQIRQIHYYEDMKNKDFFFSSMRLIKRNAMKVCLQLRWKKRRYVERLADGGLPIFSDDSRLCIRGQERGHSSNSLP